jgi:hypothetical protein
MSTIENRKYEINGVIDTNKSVMDNLETICTASSAWLTFDVSLGKWAVVINRSGASSASFNDSNILSSINISGSGITELYNSAKIQYPHKDLNDQKDSALLEIPLDQRFPNEFNNSLEINFDIINDPIRAQLIGLTELKQSRVDKIIEFRTDYSKLGLRAGDIIDVTSEMYGFDAKKFRIVRLTEEDGADGSIILSIQALEYDESVYDYRDLNLYLRDRLNGILPKPTNATIINSDNAATTNGVTDALFQPDSEPLLYGVVSALGQKGVPSFANGAGGLLDTDVLDLYRSWITSGYPVWNGTGLPPKFIGYGPLTLFDDPDEPLTNFVVTIDASLALGRFSFNLGSGSKQISGYFPSSVYLFYNTVNNLNTASLVESISAEWQTPQVTFTLDNPNFGYYWLLFVPKGTFDLNYPDLGILPVSYDAISTKANGDGIVIYAQLFRVY